MNRKIWLMAVTLMFLFAMLSIHFIKSANPYGALISAGFAILTIHVGMKLAGIKESEKELKIAATTLYIYVVFAILWFAWKLAKLYGSQEFKPFVLEASRVITIAISINLGVRAYYTLKGDVT
ncbi:hypothetical protein [Thermococcus paralvinellae]|uniref:Uncharacterized protein n=1 Tax=Thermococcus paralvinellae TaxID=582419 RepID=W0I4A3_9EURY|nr:hypothetical protein [Thermococcus paralvinellae]AHF80884.1 Hypothetical protein TES1_1506 [Thermococcus paralvinellae]